MWLWLIVMGRRAHLVMLIWPLSQAAQYFSSRMRQSAQGGRSAVMLFRYSLLARYGYTAHRRSTHTPTR